MSKPEKQVGHLEEWALAGSCGVIVAAVATVWGSLQVAHLLGGPAAPGDPFTSTFGLVRGTVAWSGQAWVALAIVGTLVAAGLTAGVVLIYRRRGRRTRVDWAAPYLGRGKDIATLSQSRAAAAASRWGLEGAPGVSLGRTLAGQVCMQSFEDVSCVIAGPRVGKSTSYAIPAILAAPGPVLTTSNKRDVVDATRDLRAEKGTVWVFDPQGVVGEEPTWWWDPLSYITDETKAMKLAQRWSDASRPDGARTDAFFDTKGVELFADLLLAAAVGRVEITRVYTWLTSPDDVDEPIKILTSHGYELQAGRVREVRVSPDKQRAGVFGSATSMAGFLTSSAVTRWISGSRQRPQFSPDAFVASTDTLYLASVKANDGVGPLIVALTVAVCEAGERLAGRSAGGRLPVPMLGILDEICNICRWADLPDLYSHYGSKGVVLIAIVQSWSQGVRVWGEPGMEAMWSASNVKVYLGGVEERAFLEKLSAVVGSYSRRKQSRSVGRGGASTSTSIERERIFEVDDLAAWPRGRALVFASGARPTITVTTPWMAGPHAEAIRASIARHDPGAVTGAAA